MVAVQKAYTPGLMGWRSDVESRKVDRYAQALRQAAQRHVAAPTPSCLWPFAVPDGACSS